MCQLLSFITFLILRNSFKNNSFSVCLIHSSLLSTFLLIFLFILLCPPFVQMWNFMKKKKLRKTIFLFSSQRFRNIRETSFLWKKKIHSTWKKNFSFAYRWRKIFENSLMYLISSFFFFIFDKLTRIETEWGRKMLSKVRLKLYFFFSPFWLNARQASPTILCEYSCIRIQLFIIYSHIKVNGNTILQAKKKYPLQISLPDHPHHHNECWIPIKAAYTQPRLRREKEFFCEFCDDLELWWYYCYFKHRHIML